MTMTQLSKIEAFLRSGKLLSPDMAKNMFGVENLRARIAELRGSGVCIFTQKNTRGKTAYCIKRPTIEFAATAYRLVGGRVFRQ
jgi:hypothetical protein